MSYCINIEEWVEEAPQEQRRTMRAILQNMKRLKKRATYSEYAPHLDFSSPPARNAVGQVLYTLWQWCIEEGIPHLNYLVVRSDTDVPGDGIMKHYEATFNTLKLYDEYCDLQANLAERLLSQGIIVIE